MSHKKQWFFTLLLLSACSNRDFLYYEPPKEVVQPVQRTITHPLKELLQQQGLLDILWIIDNSGSMMTYQNAVKTNSAKFIDQFAKQTGLDWQMAVISTSTGEEPYLGFKPGKELTNKSPNPVQKFNDAVGQLGVMGSGYETGFEPAEEKFRKFPTYARKHAYLAVIIVTDAPDQSNVTGKDFLDFLLLQYTDVQHILSYGVFAADDLSCKTDEAWNYGGSSYEAFLKLTSGGRYDLCADYGVMLAEIGKELIKKVDVHPRINLTERPVEATLEVFYHEKALPSGPKNKGGVWYYDFDQNAIIFHDLSFAPGDEESVEIRYEKANY